MSSRMLRLGHRIRLTAPEVDRFTRISGFEPDGVKTIDDLDNYIRWCRIYYDDGSPDAATLARLMERERLRCLNAA
jgi:hypothetical protein